MIVIERNGKQTVLTGWRAWFACVLAFAGVTLVLALIAFVMLGIAVTAGAVLLIAVPVAIAVALIASLFSRKA